MDRAEAEAIYDSGREVCVGRAPRDTAGDLSAVVDRHLGNEWAWSRTHGADYQGDRDAIAPIRPTRDLA
jgi:hypothetical protein